MKYNYNNYLLIITLIVITSVTSCASARINNKTRHIDMTENSKYAFVFDSVNRVGLDSVSLYGTYPLKQKAYLLGKNQPDICEVITTEHREYEGEANYFPFTTLEIVRSCRAVGFSVAVFEPVSSYKIVDLRPISDPGLVSRLDMLVRNSAASKELRTKAQGLVPGDEDYPLNELFAQVHRFESPNAQGYIVSYKKGDSNQYGPRFVIFGESVHAFTGWCSCPYVNAFMLNDIFYFESGSGCCSCGISLKELYKIEQNKVEIVLSDSSESD